MSCSSSSWCDDNSCWTGNITYCFQLLRPGATGQALVDHKITSHMVASLSHRLTHEGVLYSSSHSPHYICPQNILDIQKQWGNAIFKPCSFIDYSGLQVKLHHGGWATERPQTADSSSLCFLSKNPADLSIMPYLEAYWSFMRVNILHIKNNKQ